MGLRRCASRRQAPPPKQNTHPRDGERVAVGGGGRGGAGALQHRLHLEARGLEVVGAAGVECVWDLIDGLCRLDQDCSRNEVN